MARLRARDPHLSAEDAANRVKSQGDVREKAARAEVRGPGAGVVVWNDGDREQLKREVDKVMAEVRRTSPAWWSWLCLLCPPIGLGSGAWSVARNYVVDGRWVREKQQERAKL
jgi:dephospho-CoA kinase